MTSVLAGCRIHPLCLPFPMLLILMYGVQSCRKSGLEKKKIVYINSYHSGFPPSEQITSAVRKGFPVDSFELSTFFMDTKRSPSEAFILKRADEKVKSILKGTSPADIPGTKNKMSKVWINSRLAEKIGFSPDEALLREAIVIHCSVFTSIKLT